MTGADPTSTVRSAYDTVAESYASMLPDARFEAPLDVAMITEFAERVATIGTFSVLDAGCGAGRMTEHLIQLGLDVSGIDLSPEMIEVARRTYPGRDFEVGDIASLAHADGRFGGVFAWYSIIHSVPADLPGIFSEFRRVVRPGGYVLVGFQAGEGSRVISRAYGHDISLTAELHSPELVITDLADAGLDIEVELVRRPRVHETHSQAVILARRPSDET